MEVEMFPATADGNDNSNDGGNPSISLVDVKGVVSAERDAKSKEADDDDADIDAQIPVGDGGETLPACHCYDDAKARKCCQIE